MGKPLERLMLTTIETIIEGIEKEPWTAFINNTFDFTSVMLNNKKLIVEIVEAKNDPNVMGQLEAKAVDKFGKRFSNSLVAKIFQLSWAALLFNVATVAEIDKVVREYNDQPEEG